MTEKILVIKLSALGDFIMALGPMEAIRRHHKDAHITLLTTRPFVDIAQRSGYFNDIIVDSRPKIFELPRWYALFRLLNGGDFSRVYDLQMNDRTRIYHRLFLHKPLWSGAVPGSALYCDRPDLKSLHAFTRHQEVLKRAGIDVTLPDLSWMTSDIGMLGLKKPYVLLVPGSAPQHLAKRWPPARYAALALKFIKEGYQVAALGTAAEAETIGLITKSCPALLDLSGRTSLYDIATLARGAVGAIGNDTGPMHLISLTGCRTIVLFSEAVSHPELSAPVGPATTSLLGGTIEDISVSDVYKEFQPEAAQDGGA